MDTINFILTSINYIINHLIILVADTMNFIFNFLPDSPFLYLENFVADSVISKCLSYASYFLPVSEIVNTFVVWLGCYSIYFIYSSIMRKIKMIP